MKALVTRLAVVLATLVLCSPVFAQGWSTYANKRFGATADVPPGFEQMGPEAANADGLIFRSRHGAILTIYGANVPGSNFEGYIDQVVAHEEGYNGWRVPDRTVTPDWAELKGSLGGRQLRLRILSTCGGRQAISAKLEFNGNMSSEVDRVFSSLKAGPASSC